MVRVSHRVLCETRSGAKKSNKNGGKMRKTQIKERMSEQASERVRSNRSGIKVAIPICVYNLQHSCSQV